MAVETIVYYIIFILADIFIPAKWFSPFAKWRKRRGEAMSISETISVRRLTKTYKSESVVDKISFDVANGEILAVVGPNGAGKSSILGMIAGCRHISSGQIDFFGVNAGTSPHLVHRIAGYCPQDNIFMNELKATEWLNAVCALRGVPDYDYSKILFALGLDEQTRPRIGDMSGGNKRKVCLASALVCDPSVVVLDEATSGVDFTSRTRIWSLISGLRDTTIIMATHTLEECEKIADRIMVVCDGKITNLASPNELRQSFKCGYLIETEESNLRKLRSIMASHSVSCDCEVSEGRVRAIISSDEVRTLAAVLRDIDFKYLMSIQNLEEKIFSQIQEHEMDILRRRSALEEELNSYEIPHV
jgi:ABC-type multidrug transport system ATPase subunit